MSKGTLRYAVIVAAVLAVFGRVVRAGFVYDDGWTLVHNAALQRSFASLMRATIGGSAGSAIPDATRPLMVASMWLDRNVLGTRPLLLHLESLLLYALCALLVLAFLRSLLTERGALLGALFFVVAPVHAEVVATINYREDLLVAVPLLFLLVSARRELRPSSFDLALAALAMALAALAKESAFVILPLVLLVARRERRSVVVAVSVVWLVMLLWRVRLAGDDIPRASWSIAERITRSARYEVLAAATGFFPFAWAPDRAPMSGGSWWWVPVLAALVLMLARLRSVPLRLGLAIALIAPLATAPLVGPYNEVADRYFFVAVLGGAVGWGCIGDRALLLWPRAAALGVSVMLVAAAATTFLATGAFADDRTLWSTAVARAPRSPRAWSALAHVRRLEGDLAGADEAVAHALLIDANYPPARLTAIYNKLARGDVVAARTMLEELKPVALPGLPRARRCALLPPGEASVCITR